MKSEGLPDAFRVLRKNRAKNAAASVTEIAAAHRASPFRVLVSCIISLRTKDEVTAAASKRLFGLADTPEGLLRLRASTIEKAIFPCGFYRTKAKTLREISEDLIDRFDGRVPDTIEDLLTLKGVGRKTANLVVTLGHAKPGICVDIHVHRITNRWGYVKTKNPDETEAALRAKLPKRYWIPINDLLVVYGQKVCRPVSPFCSECGIAKHCAKVGVEKFR
ncbi:MAG: endonuclease III [Candidatus Omnitrophica bacterium]|nr:endonuclease III [Candidatus Omnitrophota bacterium]